MKEMSGKEGKKEDKAVSNNNRRRKGGVKGNIKNGRHVRIKGGQMQGKREEQNNKN